MGQQPKLILHVVQGFCDANQTGVGVGGKTRKCANSDVGAYSIALARHGISAHYDAPGVFGFHPFDGVRMR